MTIDSPVTSAAGAPKREKPHVVGRPMIKAAASHLYRIGEPVILELRAGYFVKSDATFTVVSHLPSSGSGPQYRIKATGEPYERVALEHQLKPAAASDLADSVFDKKA